MDVFEALIGQAQQYGKDQQATDPYALAARGIAAGTGAANFSNPWANLAKSALGGFATGVTQQAAQNNYQANVGDAYSQLLGGVQGQQVNPAFSQYAQPVQAALADERRKQIQKTQGFYDQMGKELYMKQAELHASPEYQDSLKYGGGMVDTYAPRIEQASAKGSGILGGIAPQRGLLPNNNPMQRAQAPVQDVSAPEASAVMDSLRQEAASPAQHAQYFQPQQQAQAMQTEWDQTMHMFGGDRRAAERYMDRQDKARQESTKMDETLRKESKDYLNTQLDSINRAKSLETELESAINRSGDTGGPFLPEVFQGFREANLKTQASFGVSEAQQRVQGQKSLEEIGLKAAGEIRKDFPGSVSNKEMELFLGAAPSQNNTPEQNQELFGKIRRARIAKELGLGFIQGFLNRNRGATLEEAKSAFAQYENQNPLFIPDPQTGKLEINPVRLGEGATVQIPQQTLKQEDLEAQGYVRVNGGWQRR